MSGKAKEKWVATRGVSWRVGDSEIGREAGEDVSDAPAAVLKEWAALEPPAVALAGAKEAGVDG